MLPLKACGAIIIFMVSRTIYHFATGDAAGGGREDARVADATHRLYIESTMRLIAVRLSVLTLLVALVLPTVGPLIDHHFAEREVGHHHLEAHQSDAHAHSHQGPHLHSPDGGPSAEGQPIALYEYESSLAVGAVSLVGDSALQSVLKPNQGYVTVLHSSSLVRTKQHYTAPSKRPPQRFL